MAGLSPHSARWSPVTGVHWLDLLIYRQSANDALPTAHGRRRGMEATLWGGVSLLLRVDASTRRRAAAGRLASRILGEGIARINASPLVACTPARLAIAAVWLSLSATALGGRPDDWLDRRRHRRPEREPMTWRRGDGDRPRRAPGPGDRRGRRLQGRRSGARRRCRHGGAARGRGRGDRPGGGGPEGGVVTRSLSSHRSPCSMRKSPATS